MDATQGMGQCSKHTAGGAATRGIREREGNGCIGASKHTRMHVGIDRTPSPAQPCLGLCAGLLSRSANVERCRGRRRPSCSPSLAASGSYVPLMKRSRLLPPSSAHARAEAVSHRTRLGRRVSSPPGSFVPRARSIRQGFGWDSSCWRVPANRAQARWRQCSLTPWQSAPRAHQHTTPRLSDGLCAC
jgi:hypothetical protein